MSLRDDGIPVECITLTAGACHGPKQLVGGRPKRSAPTRPPPLSLYHVGSVELRRSQHAAMDEARVHSAANWLVRGATHTSAIQHRMRLRIVPTK